MDLLPLAGLLLQHNNRGGVAALVHVEPLAEASGFSRSPDIAPDVRGSTRLLMGNRLENERTLVLVVLCIYSTVEGTCWMCGTSWCPASSNV